MDTCTTTRLQIEIAVGCGAKFGGTCQRMNVRPPTHRKGFSSENSKKAKIDIKEHTHTRCCCCQQIQTRQRPQPRVPIVQQYCDYSTTGFLIYDLSAFDYDSSTFELTYLKPRSRIFHIITIMKSFFISTTRILALGLLLSVTTVSSFQPIVTRRSNYGDRGSSNLL